MIEKKSFFEEISVTNYYFGVIPMHDEKVKPMLDILFRFISFYFRDC